MSFGITKTIPAKAGVEVLDSLYDGSRKEYRLRGDHEGVEQDTSAHTRRRKKRFGGKETRRREWSYNPETERYKSWCVITYPRLDE